MLVRFDLDAGVQVSVGGEVERGAVDELCEVIDRSVQVTGRRVLVDLAAAQVSDDVVAMLIHRCSDVATIVPPVDARESSLGGART